MGHLHRLIAFDLDGTLVDSQRDLANAVNQLIEELGGRPLPHPDIAGMIGEGARLLVGRALTAAGLEQPDRALERFLDIYDRRLLEHTVPYEGIAEVLGAARERAYVAVLTNKPRAAALRILDGLGLAPLVEQVVGGDGPCPRKPHPAALAALMRAAVAPRAHTLLIGDSAIDLETARRADVACCLALYGFGRVTLEPAAVATARWTADTPRGLLRVLDEFGRIPHGP